MEFGMVGLGRMGSNLVRRAIRSGHRAVVYDVEDQPVKTLAQEGARGAASLKELVEALDAPRSVWVMVPAAHTEQVVTALAELLEPNDLVVDGGNTFYRDDLRRAEELAGRGIRYVDVGTSGGIHGMERGFCLMVGGEPDAVHRLEPLFRALAPGVEAAPRTRSRSGTFAPAEQGFLHCGPAGAGHFVKMVHNGIEYGVMAAFAEGFNLLAHAGVGHEGRPRDADTAPLRSPEAFRFDLPMADIAEVWRRGSVLSSWLLDLAADELNKDPALHRFSGRVSDSGEGRWAVEAAVEAGVPAPVLSAALFQRFSSRGESAMADRMLSAMRKAFGGHEETGD